MKHYFLALHVVLITLSFSGSDASPDEISVFTHPAMGTEFELRLVLPFEEAEALAEEVFHLVDVTEEEISDWRETSYTTYVNRHAADGPVRVSPGMLELYVDAKRLSEISFGAFDPTIGSLMEIWKIRSGGAIPTETAIAGALERTGMRHVYIDETESTIRYGREGVTVDLGGIGKGYVLDLAATLLRGRGVDAALFSAGTSTILALGAPPGESGWEIAIPDAAAVASKLPSVLLRDAALSTSACYQTTEAPCDILDPRVGRPVSRASSATVIAKRGAEADALSTALLVMTRREAESFFDGHRDYEAVRFAAEPGEPETYNWNH